MLSIKKIKGLHGLRLCCARVAMAVSVLMILAAEVAADSCLAPPRPYVPKDPAAMRDYAEIIRGDVELYFRDIQAYFRCLEDERARAFEEAQEVSAEYGRFLSYIGD